MNSFYSAKCENIFLPHINNSTTNEISNIFLTIVHIVIQWWHTQKLEMLHLKLENISGKDKNIKSTHSIKQT